MMNQDIPSLLASLTEANTKAQTAIALLAKVQLEHTRGLKLAAPPKFSGDPEEVEAFLCAVKRHFVESSAEFVSERAKVNFAASHLTGEAAAWFNRNWSSCDGGFKTFDEFEVALRHDFGDDSAERKAIFELGNLRQGTRSCLEYWREFQAKALLAGYNRHDNALKTLFVQGISKRVRSLLDGHPDLPRTVEDLASLCCKLDGSKLGQAVDKSDKAADSSEAGTPMEIDALGRSRNPKKLRLYRAGLCFACEKPGHTQAKCPNKTKSAYVGVASIGEYPVFKQRVKLGGRESWALIDSGATRCCVNARAAKRWRLPLRRLERGVPVRFGNSREVVLSLETIELDLEVGSAGYSGKFSFLVVPDLSHDVIIGLTWFQRARPLIDWDTLSVRRIDNAVPRGARRRPHRQAQQTRGASVGCAGGVGGGHVVCQPPTIETETGKSPVSSAGEAAKDNIALGPNGSGDSVAAAMLGGCVDTPGEEVDDQDHQVTNAMADDQFARRDVETAQSENAEVGYIPEAQGSVSDPQALEDDVFYSDNDEARHSWDDGETIYTEWGDAFEDEPFVELSRPPLVLPPGRRRARRS